MPEALCRWQSLDSTMTFHYVSSMMYQLLPSIRQFFEIVHFPQGSFHVSKQSIKTTKKNPKISDASFLLTLTRIR
jgi:phosphatidate phosphatase APP1